MSSTPTSSSPELLSFDSLSLSPEVKRAIGEMGFEKASPIQSQAIPILLQGLDIIGQAQTGTGKTAAFAIPIIDMVQMNRREIQALVLCPTRELALQVAGEFRKLGKYKHQLLVAPIFGGQSIDRQMQLLRRRPQIVIGTPGRVLDLISRGALNFSNVRALVLDEADEMLNMGFRRDIEQILKHTPSTRQTIFFSATMPRAILELTAQYQRQAQHVKVARAEQALPLIEQHYFEVQRANKFQALVHVMSQHEFNLALVFCNTKWQVDRLVKRLKTRNLSVEGLHGGMTQARRARILQDFREGKLRLLVATDVAARGLDINNVEAVFNFDLPKDSEFYVHRIGRTGRAGKTGMAFTFVEDCEFHQLRQLRKAPNVNLLKQELPALA